MLGEDQEHKKENKNIIYIYIYIYIWRRELAEFWEETQGERKKT